MANKASPNVGKIAPVFHGIEARPSCDPPQTDSPPITSLEWAPNFVHIVLNKGLTKLKR
jgi:hypothetical protein